jgi:hypothetical protein
MKGHSKRSRTTDARTISVNVCGYSVARYLADLAALPSLPEAEVQDGAAHMVAELRRAERRGRGGR